MGWSPLLHTGFLVSCATLDTPQIQSVSITGLLPSLVMLSSIIHLLTSFLNGVLTPNKFLH